MLPKRWEYKHELLVHGTQAYLAGLIPKVAELGLQGWELVTVLPGTAGLSLVLKRELLAESATAWVDEMAEVLRREVEAKALEAKSQQALGELVPTQAVEPVDRTQVYDIPTSGKNGQRDYYTVLSDEERARGYQRPVRTSYIHVGRRKIGGLVCNAVTRAGLQIAETFARDPDFYSHTYCSSCQEHLPVGEFLWEGTNEPVGS